MKKRRKNAASIVDRYRVTDGKKFRLDDHDPGDTADLSVRGKAAKEKARAILADGIARLAELQDRLYAQDRWGLLLIFQAMDAAGKDSTIKHVMSGVNPQGVQVTSFKVPSSQELDHDFLWRGVLRLPERGCIGIFNRSYYEEVLVVRVHPQILQAQKLPPELLDAKVWERRYEDINAFERYLSRNGFPILKFFLNVSRKEQKKRFLERLDEPEKNWKFSIADVHERESWSAYQKAYQDAIAATSTPWAPWFVVPADHKWFTRLVVAAAIVAELETLNLRYPALSKTKRRELQEARRLLR
ncbi:MAG TPA: polyphosphate kinase 2 family protein [Thermoanaerobaculia bacterium]|jgi:PPK2 family polyphosphate:nucleotide phosphotransferase